MLRVVSLTGFVAFVAFAYLISSNRKKINTRTVVFGLGLQILFGLIILKTAFGQALFRNVNTIIIAFLDSTKAGSSLLFGQLTEWSVQVGKMGTGGFEADAELIAHTGSFFAFTVLPTIIFFSCFMAIAFHLGIIQKLVTAMAWLMSKTMRTSGAESLSASANIFVGQTEAPLVIRPYVEKMTRSELMAVMVAGFATVAGGVMAAYVAMLKTAIPNIAGHLMAASIMAAPCALVIAKILIPETEESQTASTVKIVMEKESANVVDAAATGTSIGLKLALNVGAMLLAFLALVAMFDSVLGWLGSALFDYPELSLSVLLGYAFSPFAALMGIPKADILALGDLLGTKIVLNEFVAYAKLQTLLNSGEITQRTALIASYALCGFANVGSIGIQLGGIGGMAPNRRKDLAELVVKAMFAGALVSIINACVAGFLL